ncbi:MAG: TonB family protein [Bryobacteraceae bacterium]
MSPGQWPEKIGPYEIEGILGRGGFGVVYRARDPQLGRSVAIKALLNPDGDASKFMREGEVLARLQHPNIVLVLNALEWQGQQMIVMELVPGVQLHQWFLADPPPALLDRILILEQIALAMAHAHGHGVQHRDLKPANVMVLPGGKVKVLDFGIARRRPATGGTIDSSSALSGTLSYMAPEQLEHGQSGFPSDVFSFGVVAYELLSGQHPFPGDTQFLVQLAIVKLQPPPLSQRIPELPIGIQTVINRCLEKAPANRYKDLTEVGRLLQRASLPLKQHVARQWAQWGGEALAHGNRADAEKAASLAEALDPGCPALLELHKCLDQPAPAMLGQWTPELHSPANRGAAPAPARKHSNSPLWVGAGFAVTVFCAIGIWLAVNGNRPRNPAPRANLDLKEPENKKPEPVTPAPRVVTPTPVKEGLKQKTKALSVPPSVPPLGVPKPSEPKTAEPKQPLPDSPSKEDPEPAAPSRIRLSGYVQAANIATMVRPTYPLLAKQARIQGTVRFNAVIAKDGTILSLQVVTGHPLLIPAATEAVRQWIYKPTFLSSQPVEVQTQIDVNFTLSN